MRFDSHSYKKYLVYTDKPASNAVLAVSIERISVKILVEMFEKLTKNPTFRMIHLKYSCGDNLQKK